MRPLSCNPYATKRIAVQALAFSEKIPEKEKCVRWSGLEKYF